MLSKCLSVAEVENLVLTAPREHFNAVTVASCIYKLGKFTATKQRDSRQTMTTTTTPAVAKLLSIAERHHGLLEPYSLSNISYGIAVGRLTLQMPDYVAEKLTRKRYVDKCSSQDLSMSIWALATLHGGEHNNNNITLALKTVSDALVDDSAQQPLPRPLDAFTFQSIANLLWGYATLQYKCDKLFQFTANELVTTTTDKQPCARDWAEIKPQDMSNIAWAFASSGMAAAHPVLLFERFAVHCSETPGFLSQFKPQEAANLAWALAKCNLSNGDALLTLAQEIDNVVMANLPRYSSRELAHVSWAAATARRSSSKVPLAAARQLMATRQHHLHQRDCVDVLWSLAATGPDRSSEEAAVVKEYANWVAKHVLPSFTRGGGGVSTLCLALWCFACLDVLVDAVEVRRMLCTPLTASQLAGMASSSSSGELDRQQLGMVRLAWNQQKAVVGSKAVLLDQLEGAIPTSSLPSSTTVSSSSQNHKSITNWLRLHVCADIQDEVCLLGGVVVVDAYIPSINMVVEIDGPHHYDRETGRVALGSTLFKRRLLANAGHAQLALPLQRFQSSDRQSRLEMFHPIFDRLQRRR